MITVKVNREQVEERVTVDEYLALAENDLKAIVNIMAKFVVDAQGNYLPPAEGRAAIGKATMKELTEVSKQFAEAVKSIVPPENGGG